MMLVDDAIDRVGASCLWIESVIRWEGMSHAVDLPAGDARGVVPVTAPTFDELAFLRFRTREDDEAGGDRFRAARDRFEQVHGPISEAWWSASTPAAIALTFPKIGALASVVGAQSGAQIHRATDWETRDYPEVTAALHEADGLAVRCREILRGTAQRVALTHIWGSEVSLLGVLEQHGGVDRDMAKHIADALLEFRHRLREADAYYRQAAARTTQIFYFWGMIVGVFLIALLTSAVAIGVHFLLEWSNLKPDANTFALVLTAVSAGGLGACISAMWRISSGTFSADYEAGSTHARTIGSFRPFIGAIFGLGLYVALRAGFLPTLQAESNDFYLAAFLAFLGGFSERLAPDVFAKAEDRVGASATNQQQSATPPSSPPSE
jgi:hypothetical protein